MGRLAGKRAIVTGGANGIGRAISEAFAREGADVFLTAKSDEAAARDICATLAQLGRNVGYTLLDAADAGAIGQLFARSEACFGSADILVNNAATAARTQFLEMSREEYERTLRVNLEFPFFATQCFATALINAGRHGSVINIASVSAARAVSKLSAYQCSKAGLVMFGRSAAYELARYDIRVNTISPGLTATKANSNQWRDDPEVWAERGRNIPLGRAGRPMDVAGAAVFLASDESAWVTGAELIVDGGENAM